MAYKFELPKEILRNLWQLREYCGGPTIAESVRRAVRAYIEDQERRLGIKLEDAAEAIKQHEREKAQSNL